MLLVASTAFWLDWYFVAQLPTLACESRWLTDVLQRTVSGQTKWNELRRVLAWKWVPRSRAVAFSSASHRKCGRDTATLLLRQFTL